MNSHAILITIKRLTLHQRILSTCIEIFNGTIKVNDVIVMNIR